MGYFGVTVRDATGGRLAKWGPGSGTTETDTVDNHYAGLENTTSTTLHSSSPPPDTGATVTTTWRVNPDGTTVAGAYDATVTVTATALP